MTSIKQIREAIDSGLDSLKARAEAAAAHLNLSDDEVHERIAGIQDKLKESASALQSKMAETEEFAAETAKEIKPALEHLQVQLALGKADSRDAFIERKKQIQHAIAEFNARLDAADAAEDREMAAEVDAYLKAYAEQAAALEAELAVMEESYEKQEGASS